MPTIDGSGSRGKSIILNIASIGFLLITLFSIVGVVTNPYKAVLSAALAGCRKDPRDCPVSVRHAARVAQENAQEQAQEAGQTITTTTDPCSGGCSTEQIRLDQNSSGQFGSQYANGDIAGFYRVGESYFRIAESSGGPSAGAVASLVDAISTQAKVKETVLTYLDPDNSNEARNAAAQQIIQWQQNGTISADFYNYVANSQDLNRNVEIFLNPQSSREDSNSALNRIVELQNQGVANPQYVNAITDIKAIPDSTPENRVKIFAELQKAVTDGLISQSVLDSVQKVYLPNGEARRFTTETNMQVSKTDEGFDRTLTTIVKDDNGNIVDAQSQSVVIEKTPPTIEKTDNGFVTTYTQVVRNAVTGEVIQRYSIPTISETNTVLEKTDLGFIQKTTVTIRNANTNEVIDSQTQEQPLYIELGQPKINSTTILAVVNEPDWDKKQAALAALKKTDPEAYTIANALVQDQSNKNFEYANGIANGYSPAELAAQGITRPGTYSSADILKMLCVADPACYAVQYQQEGIKAQGSFGYTILNSLFPLNQEIQRQSTLYGNYGNNTQLLEIAQFGIAGTELLGGVWSADALTSISLTKIVEGEVVKVGLKEAIARIGLGALNTYARTGFVQQSAITAGSWILSPGSPETLKQTGLEALFAVTMGQGAYLGPLSSVIAGGKDAVKTLQVARVISGGLVATNLGVGVPLTIGACQQGGMSSFGCIQGIIMNTAMLAGGIYQQAQTGKIISDYNATQEAVANFGKVKELLGTRFDATHVRDPNTTDFAYSQIKNAAIKSSIESAYRLIFGDLFALNINKQGVILPPETTPTQALKVSRAFLEFMQKQVGQTPNGTATSGTSAITPLSDLGAATNTAESFSPGQLLFPASATDPVGVETPSLAKAPSGNSVPVLPQMAMDVLTGASAQKSTSLTGDLTEFSAGQTNPVQPSTTISQLQTTAERARILFAPSQDAAGLANIELPENLSPQERDVVIAVLTGAKVPVSALENIEVPLPAELTPEQIGLVPVPAPPAPQSPASSNLTPEEQIAILENNGSLGFPEYPNISYPMVENTPTTIETSKISSINSELFSTEGDPNHLSVDQIRQLMRDGKWDPTLYEYAQDPITAYELPDGTIHIQSGRHRVEAYILEGVDEIPNVILHKPAPQPPAAEVSVTETQATTEVGVGTKVPDPDPNEIGMKARMDVLKTEGKSAEEAFQIISKENDSVVNWVNDNTAVGDVVRTKDGYLYIKTEATWRGLTEDGKKLRSTIVVASTYNLRGAEIVNRKVTISKGIDVIYPETAPAQPATISPAENLAQVPEPAPQPVTVPEAYTGERLLTAFGQSPAGQFLARAATAGVRLTGIALGRAGQVLSKGFEGLSAASQYLVKNPRALAISSGLATATILINSFSPLPANINQEIARALVNPPPAVVQVVPAPELNPIVPAPVQNPVVPAEPVSTALNPLGAPYFQDTPSRGSYTGADQENTYQRMLKIGQENPTVFWMKQTGGNFTRAHYIAIALMNESTAGNGIDPALLQAIMDAARNIFWSQNNPYVKEFTRGKYQAYCYTITCQNDGGALEWLARVSQSAEKLMKDDDGDLLSFGHPKGAISIPDQYAAITDANGNHPYTIPAVAEYVMGNPEPIEWNDNLPTDIQVFGYNTNRANMDDSRLGITSPYDDRGVYYHNGPDVVATNNQKKYEETHSFKSDKTVAQKNRGHDPSTETFDPARDVQPGPPLVPDEQNVAPQIQPAPADVNPVPEVRTLGENPAAIADKGTLSTSPNIIQSIRDWIKRTILDPIKNVFQRTSMSSSPQKPAANLPVGSSQSLPNSEAISNGLESIVIDRQFTATGPNPFKAHIVTAGNLENAQFVFNPPTELMSTKDFLEATGSVVAINADGYDMGGPSTINGLSYYKPEGPAIIDGVQYRSLTDEASLYFDEDGKLILNRTPEGKLSLPLGRKKPDGAVTQISFPNLLINEGVLQNSEGFDRQVNARTALIIKNNGEIVIISVQGSQTQNGSGLTGATVEELQQLALQEGADIAINFDGGGSTSLATNVSGTPTVLNVGADGIDAPVAVHLGIQIIGPVNVTPTGATISPTPLNQPQYLSQNPNGAVFYTNNYRPLPKKYFLDEYIKPQGIVLHWDENPYDPTTQPELFTTNLTYKALKERKTSVHFGVDPNGVTQFMPLKADTITQAYGNSGLGPDINIEFVGMDFGKKLPPQSEIDHAVDLITRLVIQYKLDVNNITHHIDQADVNPEFVELIKGLVRERIAEISATSSPTEKQSGFLGFLTPAIANAISGPFTAIWTGIPGVANQISTWLQPGSIRYGIDAVRNGLNRLFTRPSTVTPQPPAALVSQVFEPTRATIKNGNLEVNGTQLITIGQSPPWQTGNNNLDLIANQENSLVFNGSVHPFTSVDLNFTPTSQIGNDNDASLGNALYTTYDQGYARQFAGKNGSIVPLYLYDAKILDLSSDNQLPISIFQEWRSYFLGRVPSLRKKMIDSLPEESLVRGVLEKTLNGYIEQINKLASSGQASVEVTRAFILPPNQTAWPDVVREFMLAKGIDGIMYRETILYSGDHIDHLSLAVYNYSKIGTQADWVQRAASGQIETITRDQLDEVLKTNNYSPDKLIGLLSQNFAGEYQAGAGVWEGYTIERHTKMVLGQFDKYFSKNPLPGGVSNDFMRTVLALHDIGKPEALAKGNKSLQYEYTLAILEKTLKDLGFSENEQKIASALVNGDPIGDVIKAGSVEAVERNAKRIADAAQIAGMSTSDFFGLLTIYYRSDAGSYTLDAGGIESLDDLFVFDKENGIMTFAPKQQEIIDKLQSAIAEISTNTFPQESESIAKLLSGKPVIIYHTLEKAGDLNLIKQSNNFTGRWFYDIKGKTYNLMFFSISPPQKVTSLSTFLETGGLKIFDARKGEAFGTLFQMAKSLMLDGYDGLITETNSTIANSPLELVIFDSSKLDLANNLQPLPMPAVKPNGLIGFLPSAVANTLSGPIAAIWTGIPGLATQISTWLQPGSIQYGIDALRNSLNRLFSRQLGIIEPNIARLINLGSGGNTAFLEQVRDSTIKALGIDKEQEIESVAEQALSEYRTGSLDQLGKTVILSDDQRRVANMADLIDFEVNRKLISLKTGDNSQQLGMVIEILAKREADINLVRPYFEKALSGTDALWNKFGGGGIISDPAVFDDSAAKIVILDKASMQLAYQGQEFIPEAFYNPQWDLFVFNRDTAGSQPSGNILWQRVSDHEVNHQLNRPQERQLENAAINYFGRAPGWYRMIMEAHNELLTYYTDIARAATGGTQPMYSMGVFREDMNENLVDAFDIFRSDIKQTLLAKGLSDQKATELILAMGSGGYTPLVNELGGWDKFFEYFKGLDTEAAAIAPVRKVPAKPNGLIGFGPAQLFENLSQLIPGYAELIASGQGLTPARIAKILGSQIATLSKNPSVRYMILDSFLPKEMIPLFMPYFDMDIPNMLKIWATENTEGLLPKPKTSPAPALELTNDQFTSDVISAVNNYKPEGCSNCSRLLGQINDLLRQARETSDSKAQLKALTKAANLLLDHAIDNQVAYASGKILTDAEIFDLFGVGREEFIQSIKDGLQSVDTSISELPPGASEPQLNSLQRQLSELLVRFDPKQEDLLLKNEQWLNFQQFVYYITGTWPVPGNEYLLAQRVESDHYIIKQKYGLPPRDLKFTDIKEYIYQLEQIAKNNNVPVRSATEYQTFFDSYPAGAVYTSTGEIYLPLVDQNEKQELLKYASNLEHELIHALQHIRYPGLPIEAAEYEAYVGANISLGQLQENPIDSLDILFGFFMHGSVKFWYEHEQQVKPWTDLQKPLSQPPAAPAAQSQNLLQKYVNWVNSILYPPLGIIEPNMARLINSGWNFEWRGFRTIRRLIVRGAVTAAVMFSGTVNAVFPVDITASIASCLSQPKCVSLFDPRLGESLASPQTPQYSSPLEKVENVDLISNVINSEIDLIEQARLSRSSNRATSENNDLQTTDLNTRSLPKPPSGLTSKPVNCISHCDGERMNYLYEWYKTQPDGWWYHDGQFTPADFAAMMVMGEAQGINTPQDLKAVVEKIAEAVSYQLWNSSPENGRPGYCNSPDCQGGGGYLNFIGAYSQSAWVRYTSLTTNPSAKTLEGLKDQALADYYSQNGVSLDQIAEIISHPKLLPDKKYIDLPTEWGCRGCGDPGLNWVSKAIDNNAPTGTTDYWGVYYIGPGRNGEVIYTLNQAAFWSYCRGSCLPPPNANSTTSNN